MSEEVPFEEIEEKADKGDFQWNSLDVCILSSIVK
jgi:hypothetical protein